MPPAEPSRDDRAPDAPATERQPPAESGLDDAADPADRSDSDQPSPGETRFDRAGLGPYPDPAARPGLIGDPFAEVFGADLTARSHSPLPRPSTSQRPPNWPQHPATLSDDALATQCRIGRERSGGPGGQNRNKVETAVVITHNPTGLIATASERRSVRENRPVAFRRLRLLLAVQLRVGVPDGEARSTLWLSRTPDSRIVISTRHRDFPSMLAEAMDMLAACRWEPRRAALRLGVSPSQLVKLLREHAPALTEVNAQRLSRGEHTLK